LIEKTGEDPTAGTIKGGYKSLDRVRNLFDAKKFVETYLPYVCLWMTRLLSIAIAYYYHGIPALVVLTWILLSFMVKLVRFVRFTILIYLPVIIFFFFYGYILNIPGLF
jgi:hypothetical protein